jgi:hypothetical protein
MNVVVNGKHFVSLPGFVENAIGPGSTGAQVVGYGLAAASGLLVAFVWWRHPHENAAVRWSLAAATVVVVAPQTLFYDAGLLLFGLVAIQSNLRTRWKLAMGSFVAVSWLQMSATTLGWSPLGPIVWVVFALLLRASLTPLLRVREPI